MPAHIQFFLNIFLQFTEAAEPFIKGPHPIEMTQMWRLQDGSFTNREPLRSSPKKVIPPDPKPGEFVDNEGWPRPKRILTNGKELRRYCNQPNYRRVYCETTTSWIYNEPCYSLTGNSG